ncbi:MAG: hypothetical protein OYH77_00635, partial [Pseudomonadota bacterium]|nr:hypothetical protein [Pseudomonadota bacterium]
KLITPCKHLLSEMATRPNYNAANRKVYDALDDRDKSLALALATSVYAQAIFFDCNVREQFIDDRPQKTESTDTYDLYRAVSRKDKLFDWTRFVEWREIKAQDGTIAKTDGEADTVKGKMINLYSQNTNTYVSLDKQSDVRQIGATYNFKVANDGSNNDVDTVVWRGAIVEYKSGTDKEHLLGLRTHHHREQDKLYLLLAHFKATGDALLFDE